MPFRFRPFTASRAGLIVAALASVALAGCKSTGELVVEEGVGITAIRSACPAVGIADGTGEVTLFKVPGNTSADNIDVTAAITDVRSTCDPKASPVNAQVSFKVLASRRDGRGARDVTVPYFVTVMRGGNVVVAKRIAMATVHFEDGQTRAQGNGTGTASIDKKEATLDPAIRNRITRARRGGDADAAVDPLSDPQVKAAIARASFEVLVGFQLTTEQLGYNATR
ncbi:hypothetical protein GTZ99_09585 [Novosphingobium sp. FSY-8]|uniref:Lipoprotein n=1 Tax=Novosphingobium ovatum TaxID=1908523 RepID=A0ABW9XE47_9SPHN|nr:hypothetical protein [Novosphingobium ovatum]NBC36807.1 hypothetical protein [Novosphingobium ovatum]